MAAQPAPEEDEAARQQAPAKRKAPAVATTDRVRDPAKGTLAGGGPTDGEGEGKEEE
jgi:hypothetical protein